MCRIKNEIVAEECRVPYGFTLIELLITGSVMGIIALAIFSTLSMGLKAYHRLQYYGLVQADVLLSLEKMERDLRNARNLIDIQFVGENNKVSFAGGIGPQGGPDLGRISYYFDARDHAFIKKEEDYSSAVYEGSTGQRRFEALASVKNLVFSFCSVNPETWQDSWPSGSGVPQAVRIKITFKGSHKDVEITRTVVMPLFDDLPG